MSKDRIITQPLDDPLGSIYEIDGKCYVKTSDSSGTMNKLVTGQDGNAAKDYNLDLVKCETGAGARTAAVSTGGGFLCHGNALSLNNIDFQLDGGTGGPAHRWRLSWPLGYSAPGGTIGPREQGIDVSTIPYIIESNHNAGRTSVKPATLDYWYSAHWCKILHGGWIRFSPASVINGFDEFFYWGRGRWPFNRPVGWYKFSVQHAETDEWHVVKYFNSGYFRVWLGHMLGYTESQTNRINPKAYSLGGTLQVHVHLTPRNDDPYLQVDPKFHNMPIKSVEVFYRTGTMFVMSHYMYSLQMYKNGEKQNLMDNSILLRQAPAKGHGALM